MITNAWRQDSMAWIWDVPPELMFWTLGSQMKVIMEGCGECQKTGPIWGKQVTGVGLLGCVFSSSFLSHVFKEVQNRFSSRSSTAPYRGVVLLKCICSRYFPVLILYCSTQDQWLWVKPQEEAAWTLAFSLWVRIDQIAKDIESFYILNRKEAHTWATSMRLNYKTFKTLKVVVFLVKYLEILLKDVLMMYKYLKMFNLLYS